MNYLSVPFLKHASTIFLQLAYRSCSLPRFVSAVIKKEERVMAGLFGVVARDDCAKEVESREDINMAKYLIPGSQEFSQTTLPECGL